MARGDGLASGRALPILVLVSLLGLLAMDLDRRRTVIDELTAVRRLGQIHADAAVAHLWVEEWLSGDEIDESALKDRLDRLQVGPAALISGPWARAQPENAQELLGLQQDVAQFQEITEDRLEGRRLGLQVGIGSTFDVEYDRVFNRVLDRVASLEQAFEAQRSWAERRHAMWFRSLLALCGLAVLATAWIYLRRERERRGVEHELAEKEQHLLRLQKIEVLGRLAGGLAHDINNYLAAIRSQCELLALELEDLDGPTDAQRARLGAIVGTSARAGALIERLLAFGSQKPRVSEAVDLRVLLEGLTPMLQSTAAAGVEVEVDCEPGLWPVAAEAVQLEQAVFNLVLNALDAVAGQGRVVVEAKRRAAGLSKPDGSPLDAVEISVIDNGRGIEAEDLERIFEPFWSSKTREGEPGGHAGLGLAIVQSTVARAEGRVSVRSRVGSGTTFTLLLPRSAAEPARVATQAPTLEALGGRESILLVDDHEELREATAMLLETLGYEVQTAVDVEDAERKAAATPFDALIVDLALPDGDGLELVERLREMGGTWPAVAYTGRPPDVSDPRLERSKALGIPWVAKSSATRDLLVALRQTLETPNSKT